MAAAKPKNIRRKYSILVTGTAKQLQANHHKLWYPEKTDNASYAKALESLIEPIKNGLLKYYTNVEIQVINEIPDLSDSHSVNWGSFKLASKGLSGNTRLADVGGVPYMNDPKYHDITFQLTDIIKVCGMEKALVFGAAAASPTVVGKNAELMPNTLVPGPRHTMFAKMDSPIKGRRNSNSLNNNDNDTNTNDSATASATATNDSTVESKSNEIENNDSNIDPNSKEEVPYVGIYPSEETGCLANLFLCDGTQGPVIYLKVGQRKEEKGLNLAQCIRESLIDYRTKNNIKDQIGMGGLIKLNKGTIKSHIMPDFLDCKIESSEQCNNWLKFFNVGPDLVMYSTLITGDPTENGSMHLRTEHTHFHSTHKHHHKNEGGHYHYDTTKDVEYEGYFNIAEYIYRVEDAQYNIDKENQ